MKRFLLTTTAIAAGLAASGAMAASAPKITIGGFSDAQLGIVSEDQDEGYRGYTLRSDTEIHFNIDAQAENGLEYGAVIELEADTGGDAADGAAESDAAYLYLQGNWGRVELGSNVGAQETMRVDASTFSRATGGIGGDFYRYVNWGWDGDTNNIPAAIVPFIHAPVHYTEAKIGMVDTDSDGIADTGYTGAGDLSDRNKLTYYSPNFEGFQFGLSFTPDTGNRGNNTHHFEENGDYEEVFGAGISYEGQFGDFGVAVSATGQFGDAEPAFFGSTTEGEDLETWAFGTSVTFAGFTLGGSYGDWGETLGEDTDGQYWNFGAAYDFGKGGVSVAYFASEYEFGTSDVEFENISVGADYELAPGVVPYIEANIFDADAEAIYENDGAVVLVGTELTF